MTRLRMIVGEAWRSITASMSTTVAATMTVLVAMLVLGVFFFQIREQFDSLDLHHLESLREDQ